MEQTEKKSILRAVSIPNINRTVKNLARLRQILSVLARHGFSQLIESVGLSNYLPFAKRRPQYLNMPILGLVGYLLAGLLGVGLLISILRSRSL